MDDQRPKTRFQNYQMMKFDKRKKRKKHHLKDSANIIDEGVEIIKKKINWFYKAHFILAFFISVILFYFLVLVPIKPFSVNFITDKINQKIQKKLGPGSNFGNSYISFSPYGHINIKLTDFKSQELDAKSDIINLNIPEIDFEISLFKILMLKPSPSNITIPNPNIIINLTKKKSNEEEGVKSFKIKLLEKYLQNYIRSIKSINQSTFIKLNRLRIENAKVKVVKNKKKNINLTIHKLEFILEKNFNDEISQEVIAELSLDNQKQKIEDKLIKIDNICIIKSIKTAECNISFEKLKPRYFVDLCEKCSELAQIKGEFEFTSSILFHDKVEDINFNINSNYGNFYLTNLFTKKTFFKNLSLSGNYNLTNDNLNLYKINTKLASVNNSQQILPDESLNYIDFSLDYDHTGFFNEHFSNYNMKLLLKNVDSEKIADFWPLFLPKQNIRKWVKNHINSGKVNNAKLELSQVKNNGFYEMKNLDAKLNFTGLHLNYSDKFPSIKNIDGYASFSPKNMEIIISKANFLDSNISNSKISIANFKKPTLKIYGNINGSSADLFKHANYSSKNFIDQADKYFNGNSNGYVKVEIPLYKNISLKNSYIFLSAKSIGENAKYSEGDIDIKLKKPHLSEKISVEIDSGQAKLSLPILAIEKDRNNESILKFNIDLSKKDIISVRNITLKKQKNPKEKFVGRFDYNSNKQKFTFANFYNSYSGNSYLVKYRDYINKNNKNEPKLSITGSSINLRDYINQKSQEKFKTGNSSTLLSLISNNFAFYFSVKRVFMPNSKLFRNVKANILCSNKVCYKGYIKSDYKNKNNILFNASINEKNNNIFINIKDISYLTKSLNLFNKISPDPITINLEQLTKNNSVIYKGKLTSDKSLTLYENNTVKKLANDDLFSKVKDKIFSQNKTTFNKVEVNFNIQNEILQIESLIANNYKIGITAKGNYNFKSYLFDFKGMIIPGFIINNLFGIGNIPLIGDVVSKFITGGEGGGLFGIKFEYKKENPNSEPTFKTNKISAFIPVGIRSLFDKI